jgi:hypothetical protein
VGLGSRWFLSKYYLANAIQSKLGGRVADRLSPEAVESWRDIYDRHKGQSAWLVIGNGPSLSAKDLETLQYLPSVASNKINLLFDSTNWRPSLFTVADALLLFKFKSSHYENLPTTLVPTYGYYMCKAKQKLQFRVIKPSQRDTRLEAANTIPDPVSGGFFQGYTVTLYNIQMAMWLGAKTIYLIGCDHFYNEATHGGVKKLAHVTSQNHFHPDYRKPGEIVNNAPVEKMNEDYRMIDKLCKKFGVRIINITRKTALDIFEIGTVEDAAVGFRIKN